MSSKQKQIIGIAGLLIIGLVAGFLIATFLLPESEEAIARSVSRTRFREVIVDHGLTADDLTANDDLTVTDDATVTDDLAVTGLATVGETLGVTGNGTFSADLIVDDTFNIDDTAYALTGSQTLTPTASVYLLAPTAALTLTLGTAAPNAPDAGDFVWFVSTVTTATVIVDTTATAGGGNRTLGDTDVIGFMFDGDTWVEAFYSDNS